MSLGLGNNPSYTLYAIIRPRLSRYIQRFDAHGSKEKGMKGWLLIKKHYLRRYQDEIHNPSHRKSRMGYKDPG